MILGKKAAGNDDNELRVSLACTQTLLKQNYLAFHYFHVWRCKGRSILLELLSRPELPSHNDYSQLNYVDRLIDEIL